MWDGKKNGFEFGFLMLALVGLVAGRNRTGKQFDDPSWIPPPYHPGYQQYSLVIGGNPAASRQSSGDGGPSGPSSGYQPGPPPQPGAADGYQPGPPPEDLVSPGAYRPGPPPSNGYRPGGPPPPPSYPGSNGYRPGPPANSAIPEGYFSTNSRPFEELPPDYLGHQAGVSPYGSGHMIYYSYPSGSGSAMSSSGGYQPGKPPSQYHHHSSYGYPGYGASASASASNGPPGSGLASSSASASASSPNHHIYHGWGWRPHPPPPPPPPATMPPTSSPPPDPTFGWGPPPQPPPTPPNPVPEFSYQFSLKPSAFGWETSYNVPCGNYKIQPRVIAHLRLATQAVLPKSPPPQSPSDSQGPPLELDFQEEERHKRAASPDQNQLLASSFLDPFQLERSLHYSPYHQQQFSIPKPSFRPRTCRWNFNAAGGCKLNFKCSWFQLPALFRCDENYLHVTDHTLLLDSKFCGNRRPRRKYTSSSGKLSLTFKSEGAALPAVFDCTVICTPEEGLGSDLKTSPPPTSLPLSDVVSSPSNNPSPSVLPPIGQLYNPHNKNNIISDNSPGVLSSIKKRNSTLTINRPANKPQLRMGNCKCGVPDGHYSSKIVHGRIVGGSSMMPGESPWTAALVKRNSNRPYCGASLINNRFLLTAAHCVLNQTRKTRLDPGGGGSGSENRTGTTAGQGEKFYFDVLLNEHDITQSNEIAGGTIRAKVDGVIVHPKYDNVTFDFDAALIRLAVPVEFNPWEGSQGPAQAARRRNQSPIPQYPFLFNPFGFHSFKRRRRFIIPEIEARAVPPKPVPICLPDQGRAGRKDKDGSVEGSAPDDYAVVTGWGLVNEGGVPSNEMLKARVEMFNDTICRELYKKHNYVITNSMMCAGYINGNIDSCVGDSGSPLAIQDNERSVLTGVVSWGRGCGRKQLPGVYTKVTELMDWLYTEATTEDSVWCS